VPSIQYIIRKCRTAMKKIIILLTILLLLSGCAPGNEKYDQKEANFLSGLWHGIITPFSFIVSLFSDTTRIYETNNIGKLYDFGYLLGLYMFWHGGTRTYVYTSKKGVGNWRTIKKVKGMEVMEPKDKKRKSNSK
jgi:hypothetical protein